MGLASFALPDRSRRLLYHNRLLAKARSRRLKAGEMAKLDVYQYRKKSKLPRKSFDSPHYRRLVKVRGTRGMFWRSQLVNQVTNREGKLASMAKNVQQKLAAPSPQPIRTAGWNAQPITKFREIGLPERVNKLAPPAIPATVKGNGKLIAALTGLSLLSTAGLYFNQNRSKK